jgi:hypothetical protein
MIDNRRFKEILPTIKEVGKTLEGNVVTYTWPSITRRQRIFRLMRRLLGRSNRVDTVFLIIRDEEHMTLLVNDRMIVMSHDVWKQVVIQMASELQLWDTYLHQKGTPYCEQCQHAPLKDPKGGWSLN